MKTHLGLLMLAALAGAARAGVDTDMASDTTPWPGVHRDPPIQVGYFPLPDPYSVGLGWDGEYIWIAAGDQAGPPCKFYIFDEYGNQIDVGAQGGGATGWGHRDLTWDDGMMFGSFSTVVGAHSHAGSGVFVYEGCFGGAPINPNRALARVNGSYYTGGFGTHMYRMDWNGTWGSQASITDLGGPYPGLYGLAWGISADLWGTTAASTGELYQFDSTGFLLNVYVDPAHPTFGGCEFAWTIQYGGVLAALAQETPDGVVFYYVGWAGSPVEPKSWGRIKALFQ